MQYQFQFNSVLAESGFIMQGILLTIYLSIGSIILGSIIAILFSALRANGPRWVGGLVDVYVELLRNTPFLVQLFIIFFGLPSIGIRLTADQAALLAMTLNLAAYSTEIIRAGVDSIHRSQIEAGLSLAMTKRQIFQHVIIVPAIAKVWPALSSQFVLMLLASSICSFISVQELSGVTAIIEQRTFRSFESYIVATLLYLVLALTLKVGLLGLGRLIFPRVSGLSRVQVKGEAA
ncbi:amino acid ABC transporter permease [Chelatococcus asaccharovorans]|mgnify:CR=1 FL=1|uniref:Amino acid ABC transporter membrane protein 1 (PAAT family) n=1 Tax=Chelatococcus asaccharovorans TaxID=28210 RepID=A0A2V3U555_9HYPH|nr:amino acid ABC transporter permease [Chelatococcus asaccharovorans]MBS7702733.1 amino acid ABC transporter permease [Chelatococcus asaccharovorans]PXW57026.1 amino acid ABC transporter membrane protein 1 (PAAT family) [Chelatococcus asaccharovorans]CAH1672389.1 Amino acid ABC transporter membrane protein 1 (PAAT family) [Chelatococcus asaccharovorans]CAH1676206.1 Amino acid ABC transporter membrane protein 1 (PAAT family) [Chelatococcus asaccharovorans]